jgi:CheY-like chemotaxis protein
MKPKVLIVDDNPTNLKLAADVLRFDGYTVAVASEAAEASRAIEADPPDLILMDIQMPKVDGLTFTTMLKGAPETSRIVIVALTSSAMIGDEEKARQAGCDGYITKPIDTRCLGEQVARAWEAARGSGGAGDADPDRR